jgi:hypothetical protein
MSSIDAAAVRERIYHMSLRDSGLPESVAQDVAFHMTDWLSDLEDYVAFCTDPNAHSDEAASRLLLQFLIHVPNHLAAASKLYAGIPVTDILEVGATSEEEADAE